MPRTKKRAIELSQLTQLPKEKASNNTRISHNEEEILKFMNKKDVNRLFTKIDKLEKKIIGIDLEIINSENIENTFNSESLNLVMYKSIYSKKKYNPTRIVVKIKKITFNDSSHKIFKVPIFFFKSSGESRRVSNNNSLKTKDVWFPTDKKPFQINFNEIYRISKLEDPILQFRIRPKNKDINIIKYGRFLTLENTMISKFLSEIFK
jgi:hypothetical protein